MVNTEIDELVHRIKKLRTEMIEAAAETGLNSYRTISYSQKLDKLIMIYQKQKDIKEIVFNQNEMI
ncbi:aspartyl-phosphate phosphatase Spo0E family protein [Niallia endozanthoxylica]|uniref:Aspartyl-phosphate phosphatase Spo0E family protein n=1 Tax=Niallia endozanthoxylica TaxID=2036016 RepID=A0A5J5I686_9BACI|nr:aspartyl-phosphate phosphatase Spo0E family protein [Niallia endozanthoxylica]KAA9031675.1 aspartyl-phosphate phosphatase Spo0E family protein [Niallia endozanthoxylica]